MGFWQEKTLEEMTTEEWESICDGCGKCCLHSFIDSDEEDDSEFESTDFLREGEELLYTDIVCQYNDATTCGCSRYSERQILVPSCVQLTKENLKDIFFMPTSCSYRRLYEGRGLASWHPLKHKGSKQAMIDAGISIFGRAISELEVDLESDFESHIVDWPTKDVN
ncbi:YcgN family cysteine cluster protein [Pseudoalteromonas sp. McH1-7]|uniref:YcgN family cysteine cluster protein n=1 Tax=unclassified Pseudoalteromonas TaxID=194690 RepID=UPI000F6464F1|nr:MULTISPECIES: YcgN family cysteine cluster protein [unclassified Pseudoalteromonas]NUZ10267.1 YcgN family cysteine cluster protein [Pseudoalteromonas sp. McH1-7]RRS09846.1 YcgN family cysteine cluster protein [Pseudoalteromonas sp. J010]RXF03122.1 YcgN family cysteine cluster protein [Pseudoalteromonas sp. PS5]